jgi:hypothetical protein
MHLRSSKGAGQVGSILITLLCVNLIIVGMALYVGALSTEYGIADDNLEPVLEASEQVYSHVESIGNKTSAIQENTDTQMGYQNTMDAIGILWDLVAFVPTFMNAIILSTADIFGIAWIVPYFEAMLIVIIGFAILNWVRGGGANL